MPARTNILLVGSVLSGGGAERVLANIARHLDPEKFNVTVCHLKSRGEIGEQLLREGFPVIGAPRRQGSLSRYLTFLGLRKLAIERQIDLVHTHDTHALVDAALVRCTHPRLKMVHTFHFGNYPHEVGRYMMLERMFSPLASRLVAVGYEQSNAIRDVYRPRTGHMLVLQNGVDRPESRPDPEWQAMLADRPGPIIGAISTFIEQKGLTYLLDTAHRLKQQNTAGTFVVVGKGPLQAELEAKCRALGLADRVLFAGWKQNAASTMLPLFDIFFQTSLWEAMSLAILEAMAEGLPVVATDVGDNRHVVVQGETGVIVAPRDVDAMTSALTDLVTSKELRERYGRAGRERYLSRYTAREMTRQYEELYASILGNRKESA